MADKAQGQGDARGWRWHEMGLSKREGKEG